MSKSNLNKLTTYIIALHFGKDLLKILHNMKVIV